MAYHQQQHLPRKHTKRINTQSEDISPASSNNNQKWNQTTNSFTYNHTTKNTHYLRLYNKINKLENTISIIKQQLNLTKQSFHIKQNYLPSTSTHKSSTNQHHYYLSKANTPPFKHHILQSMDILNYWKNNPTHNLFKKPIKIPIRKGYQNKKTLIFDLDQTLIHCKESIVKLYDLLVDIPTPNRYTLKVAVNIRPFAKQLLRALYKHYQIIVYTASHPSYAKAVIKIIDPQGKYIQHILCREDCVVTQEGYYLKDLSIINRQLSKTILVDNSAHSSVLQIDNSIPIIPYHDNQSDNQLEQLLQYLLYLKNAKNVRQVNKKIFRMRQYANYTSADELVRQLYGKYI